MNKLYVLIRKDLHISYQAVQAGHAIAEWLLRFPDSEWKNNTLIYLGVDDEEDLHKWKEKIVKEELKYAEFREPDIGNQITAISCFSDGRIFSNLKLA